MCQGASNNLISINVFCLRYVDYVRSPDYSIICLLFIPSGLYKAYYNEWEMGSSAWLAWKSRVSDLGNFYQRTLKVLISQKELKPSKERNAILYYVSSSLSELESCIWIWRVRSIRFNRSVYLAECGLEPVFMKFNCKNWPTKQILWPLCMFIIRGFLCWSFFLLLIEIVEYWTVNYCSWLLNRM